MFDVLTLGEFRRMFADLPDETILAGEFVRQFAFNEIGEIETLPAVLDHAPVILLYGGQEITREFDIGMRWDAMHGLHRVGEDDDDDEDRNHN